ncbi:Alpha/Beta hydrolase protein [Macrophomina phaseolina]|uniref:Alpha/Beta hydrolase protein n=1 Tax=Macrophomina phaseolina TaxID=35725 RepID=A0ABQ8GVQ6_9PEZI|nr:Alpha/Beta hydrolase protein [Macrophomina phaseolina]
MASFTTEEGWHTTEDAAKLYTKTWKPTGEVKARLVFVHGFSDHCNTYGVLFPTLASQGIVVYTFDQRGWGRSVKNTSQRGLTGPTSVVLGDIASFITALPKHSAPLFLMGHSMGGAEVLHFAATGPPSVLRTIRGFLAESPFIALAPASRPYKITVLLGQLAAKVAPHKQMVNKLDEKLISRDPEIQKEYVEDELCHDTGTLEGLAGMLDRAGTLERGEVRLLEGAGEGGKTRVWVGHGTDDQVTEFGPVKKIFEDWKVQDKEFKAYDGWYHKLHAEPGDDKYTFANDVAAWILARSGDVSQLQEIHSVIASLHLVQTPTPTVLHSRDIHIPLPLQVR